MIDRLDTQLHVLSSSASRAVDRVAFRRLAATLPTGVTVVTTLDGGQPFGCAANAVTSLSLDPPLMLICLDRTSTTRPHLLRSSIFAINVLPAGAEGTRLCRLFARKSEDKFDGIAWRQGETGSPILEAATSWIECYVSATYPGGDHLITVGTVVTGGAGGGRPLVFFDGYTHQLGRRGGRAVHTDATHSHDSASQLLAKTVPNLEGNP